MSLLIEATSPSTLANFWANVFGVSVDPGSGPDLASLTVSAKTPQLVFERTDEPKTTPNRVVLRLVTDNFKSHLRQLDRMGVQYSLDMTDAGRARLQDLEGNEFELFARTPQAPTV